jgi:DNA-binding response OmpR family regulator
MALEVFIPKSYKNVSTPRRWWHGKIAVFDLDASGRQIGERLLNLLDTEQQRDFLDFSLNVAKQAGPSADFDAVQPTTSSISAPTASIQIGNLNICPEQRLVTIQGQKVDLTAKEFDALRLLIENRPRVLTFENITVEVWGAEYIDITPKTVHNLMSRLRQKLRVAPDAPDYIASVRGIGYQFAGAIQQKFLNIPE